MSTQFISTNKNYKRLYSEPLDPTVSFNDINSLNEYLNDPTCYVNQIIGCNEKIYIVYEDDGVKKVKSITHEKFDDVILTEEGVLNFYADGILVKSVQLPTKYARAICGEFICGEMPVGHNLQSLFSLNDEPTVWIDEVTPVNAENLNKIESKIEALKSKSTGYYSGTTPPEDTSLIWIDTSDENFDSVIDSSILNELKEVISAMQKKIIQLEADVEYLKLHGGGGIPPGPTDTYEILTENGEVFITEDGDIIVLEEYEDFIPTPVNFSLLTENGDVFITEDGDVIVLEEHQDIIITGNYIITESNEPLTTEAGENIILEEV